MLNWIIWNKTVLTLTLCIAQLARAVDAHNECPEYHTKQSDGKVPVMLGLWGMWSTPSLPLLQRLHWPGMVAPDRALWAK